MLEDQDTSILDRKGDEIPKPKHEMVRAAERMLRFNMDKLLRSLLAVGADIFDPKMILPARLQDDPELKEMIEDFRYKQRGAIMREVHAAKYAAFFILEIVAVDGIFPMEFYSEAYVRKIFNKADGQESDGSTTR